jgi:hypothetical protein
MKQPKRFIGIIATVLISALASPLAVAQDSSTPSDSDAAQSWRNFQQKTQDNFRQTQQRMRDAMSHVQITPPQSFSETKGQ